MNPTQEVRTCLDICDQRQGEDKAKQRPFCVSVAVAKAAGAYHLIPEKKRGTRVCGRDPSDTVRIGGETSGHSAEELPLWKLHPGLRRLAQLFAGYYVCNGCYSRFKGSAFKSSLQRIWEDDGRKKVAKRLGALVLTLPSAYRALCLCFLHRAQRRGRSRSPAASGRAGEARQSVAYLTKGNKQVALDWLACPATHIPSACRAAL